MIKLVQPDVLQTLLSLRRKGISTFTFLAIFEEVVDGVLVNVVCERGGSAGTKTCVGWGDTAGLVLGLLGLVLGLLGLVL